MHLATPSDGRGPVSAAPHARLPQLTVSNFESESIQLWPSPAPQSENVVTQSIFHIQAPVPADLSLPRRHSEADVDHLKNVFLGPPFSVDQPRYSPIPEHPMSPLAASSGQYPAAGPTDTIQETSFYTQDDPAAYDYSYPLSSSSELPDDSASVTSFHESASPGPSDGTDHVLQQGTASGSQQKRRRTVNRKRAAEPKDPKAANRLRDQRVKDDETLDKLYRLFVPGTAAMVPKKDRLDTSMFQSL